MNYTHYILPFAIFIGIALLQLLTVVKISKLPVEQHKYKHFWIRIVSLFPLFGVAFYYYHLKTSKKGSFDLPETYTTVSNRMLSRRKKI